MGEDSELNEILITPINEQNSKKLRGKPMVKKKVIRRRSSHQMIQELKVIMKQISTHNSQDIKKQESMKVSILAPQNHTLQGECESVYNREKDMEKPESKVRGKRRSRTHERMKKGPYLQSNSGKTTVRQRS